MSVRSAYAIYGKAAAPVTGSGRSHGDRDASPYGRGSAGVWGLADSILGSAVQRITSERNHESPAPPAQGSGRSMSGPTNPRLKRFSAASDHSAASAELQDGRGALSRSPSASNSSAALTSGSTPMTGRMALSGRPASGGQFASHTSSPISIQNLQLGAYASSKVVRPRSSGHTPIIEPKSPTSASRTGEQPVTCHLACTATAHIMPVLSVISAAALSITSATQKIQ